MPLPHWLTRVNLVVTNRLTAPIAGHLPWFCILEHVGRVTGTVRHTPLNIFPQGDGRWLVALTYGPGVQWLKNIHAAGSCRIQYRGRWIGLTAPRTYRDDRLTGMPVPVRAVLVLIGVEWFVELREA